MYPIKIDEILELLEKLGVKQGDDILIHSSFRSIYKGSSFLHYKNYKSADYARDLISEIKNYLGSGSILMPTEFIDDYHMRSFDGTIYSPKSEKTNRGFFTEAFLNHLDIQRSLHPIYNLAILGDSYAKAISTHHTLPFSMSKGSPWYQFTEGGGKIVFMGVGLNSNSLLHLPEYDLGLEYPRPVFFHKPHIFKIKDKGIIQEVEAYVHAIRWKPQTAQAFLTYLDDKNSFIKYGKIENTLFSVVDSSKQRELLMIELQDNISWYDAIGW